MARLALLALVASTLAWAGGMLWETSDSYVIDPSFGLSYVSHIERGESGNLVAIYNDADQGGGTVRYLDSASGVWSTLEHVDASQIWSAAELASGGVLSGGYLRDEKDLAKCFVHLIRPGAVGVQEVASTSDFGAAECSPSRMLASGEQALIGGYANYLGSESKKSWMVAGGGAIRGSWTVLDRMEEVPYASANVSGIALGTSGEIYVSGWADFAGTGKQSGILRQSLDHGRTWSILDRVDASDTAYFLRVAALSEKKLVVLAWYKVGTLWRNVLRVTEDGGVTWTERPIVLDPQASYETVRDLAVTPAGDTIYVTLMSLAPGHPYRWSVQRSSDLGVTWENLDASEGPQGAGGRGWSVGIDGFGDVYTGGDFKTTDGKWRGLIRKGIPN